MRSTRALIPTVVVALAGCAGCGSAGTDARGAPPSQPAPTHAAGPRYTPGPDGGGCRPYPRPVVGNGQWQVDTPTAPWSDYARVPLGLRLRRSAMRSLPVRVVVVRNDGSGQYTTSLRRLHPGTFLDVTFPTDFSPRPASLRPGTFTVVWRSPSGGFLACSGFVLKG